VIKTVAYFPEQCAKNSTPVMAAVIQSLTSRGIVVQPNCSTSDAAVIWSVLWHGRMLANQAVYTHYRSLGRPVIIAEVGALRRSHTWKISVNHVNNQGYYGHTTDLDCARPQKLGIALQQNNGYNSSILIAAQHSASLQLHGVDQEQWITQMIQTIRQHTDRPIVVRPHPRHRLNWNKLPADVVRQLTKPIADSYDSYDLDTRYHAIVNYNSGPGTLAGIAGSRPLVHQSSLAAEVGISVDNIEQPYLIDRQAWLVKMCHTEYTVSEIASGHWIDRLAPALTQT